MTARELRQLDIRLQRALGYVDALRAARDQAVIDALASGMSHTEIADATSLTRGRITQIVSAHREARG
jgi:DNA-binding NarL/FixJ family response regulator